MSAWALKFVAVFLVLVQGTIGRAAVGKLQEGTVFISLNYQ